MGLKPIFLSLLLIKGLITMVKFLRRKGEKEEEPEEKEGKKLSLGRLSRKPKDTVPIVPDVAEKKTQAAVKKGIFNRSKKQTLGQVMPRIDEICQKQETMIPIKKEMEFESATGVIIHREPKDDSERRLIKWAKHLNKEGQTYEKCPVCDDYNIIETRYTSALIVFKCTGCGKKYNLKK